MKLENEEYLFFFNDPATTEIYTLSLHDALPIFGYSSVMIDGSRLPFEDNVAVTRAVVQRAHAHGVWVEGEVGGVAGDERSEEHTSELQSRQYLVCRLLLEKKTCTRITIWYSPLT